MEVGVRDSLPRRVTNQGRVAKHVESPIGGHPDVSFSILNKGPHAVAGQSIRHAVVVGDTAANAVESVILCATPERSSAIDQQGKRTDSCPVEARDSVARPLTSGVVLDAKM